MLDGRQLSVLVAEVFLVAEQAFVSQKFVNTLKNQRRQSAELDYYAMSPDTQKLFDEAMKKEWDNWLRFQAVEVLKKSDFQDPPQTIGTRWVHVDKNEKLRRGGAKVPILAKSRLVVQGHQERVWIRSDAPTASVLCFNIICHIASTRQWVLRSADASSAFLQTAGRLGRLLLLRIPDPPPPGLSKEFLMRARGSIYGTRDAPRAWWLYLKQILVELGWVANPLEQAFFSLHDSTGVTGFLLSHVDDLLFTGTGSKFESVMQKLAERVKLTFKDLPFVFCGKTVSRSGSGAIHVNQTEASLSLESTELPKGASRSNTQELNPEQISELRRIIGSVLWIARQTRPDCLTMVSLLAQKISRPMVQDLVQANSLVDRMKADATFGLTFHPHVHLCCLDTRCPSSQELCDSPSDESKVDDSDSLVEDSPKDGTERIAQHEQTALFMASDAAFANVDNISSQAGYVVGVKCKDHFHVWDCSSYKIKRVCRSTLVAEANALVEAAEYLDYCRQ
eukprot:2880475-Amphidinium_carterae.1